MWSFRKLRFSSFALNSLMHLFVLLIGSFYFILFFCLFFTLAIFFRRVAKKLFGLRDWLYWNQIWFSRFYFKVIVDLRQKALNVNFFFKKPNNNYLPIKKVKVSKAEELSKFNTQLILKIIPVNFLGCNFFQEKFKNWKQ